MQRLEIMVPDMNDSFSRVLLDGKPYLLRFTWNDHAQRWSFGVFTTQKEPIVQGVRIVPNFPLTLQTVTNALPNGVFGAYSGYAEIARDDFVNGNAVFAYIPNEQ